MSRFPVCCITVFAAQPDPACLAATPPKDAHYDFPFTVTLKKH